MRVVRMRADRAIDLGKSVCDRAQTRVPPHPSRDGNQALDAGGAGASNNSVELVGEVRKVEMTMAVDQHWRSIAPPRRWARRNEEKPPTAPAALRPQRCGGTRQGNRNAVHLPEWPKDRAIYPPR